MNERESPTALIVGGSGDIGRVIAEKLGGMGYRLALAARDKTRMEETAAALTGTGCQVETYRCDITDDSQVEQLVQSTLSSLGKIDVLVNAAGISHGEFMLRARRESWDEMLATNLTGAVMLCRSVFKSMRKRKTGYIINIGSVAGRDGVAGRAAYSASKAGLRVMSDCLRAEARAHGVRVATVSPAMVATRMHPAEEAKTERMLRPGDVAEAVAFLLRLSSNAVVPELLLYTSD